MTRAQGADSTKGVTRLDGSAGVARPEPLEAERWKGTSPKTASRACRSPPCWPRSPGLWLTYFLLTTLRAELLGLGLSQEMLWRARARLRSPGWRSRSALWLVLRLFDARPLWAKIAAALLLSLPVAVPIAHSQPADHGRHRAAASHDAARRADKGAASGGDGC